jgi:Helitron helicase-like domain at N-terminus
LGSADSVFPFTYSSMAQSILGFQILIAVVPVKIIIILTICVFLIIGSSIRKPRDTVSMREYYAYKFQIRRHPNLLLLGGRLLQQFGVDAYVKIESYRLQYHYNHQDQIRSDLYQGIADSVRLGETQAGRVGKRTVLPASFIDGPRDMRKRYMDAMALVREFCKPDIFLTMTCNPKWDEIREHLLPGQDPQDRPDLIARVFKAKLEALKEQLFKEQELGNVIAWTYSIEFQKRGLPHVHLLMIMAPGAKLTNPDQYDELVLAEIPDPIKYPDLYKVVVAHMMHGPCGQLNPRCPCMQGDTVKQCRFNFPKHFNETTLQGDDAYPLYRRKDNGRGIHRKKAWLDNRWVVPYNPRLLMMFNCHLNVEVCSSISSVKYILSTSTKVMIVRKLTSNPMRIVM